MSKLYNHNLFVTELKRNRRFFLIWTAIILAFTVFFLSFFPTIGKMGPQMKELLEGFPDSMLQAFNMDPDMFSDVIGYYSVYYGLDFMILACIFIGLLSARLIGNERRDGTIDFLLSRPVTRNEVLFTKLLVFLTLFMVYFILQTSLALILMYVFSEEPFAESTFMLVNLYGFLLNLLFGSIGFVLAIVLKNSKSIGTTIIGIVIGTYVVDALSRVSEDTEWIGWISPFNYADFNVAAPGYTLEFWRVAVLCGVGLMLLLAAFPLFRKKDF